MRKEGIIAGKISKGQIMQGLGELLKKVKQGSKYSARLERCKNRGKETIRKPLQTSK